MGRALFDRDTSPGAEPEDLLRLDIPTLIIPGHDASHATSAARYLEECLPGAQYWDIPADEQKEHETSRMTDEWEANHVRRSGAKQELKEVVSGTGSQNSTPVI